MDWFSTKIGMTNEQTPRRFTKKNCDQPSKTIKNPGFFDGILMGTHGISPFSRLMKPTGIADVSRVNDSMTASKRGLRGICRSVRLICQSS